MNNNAFESAMELPFNCPFSLYKELLLEGLINISSNIVFIPKKYEAYIGSALKAKEV